MSRQFAIGCDNCPVVFKNLDFIGSLIDHRFYCQSHALNEPGAPAGRAEIRNFGFFVELFTHTVAYKATHYGKPVVFHICLNGMGNVGYSITLTGKFKTFKEALTSYIDKSLCLRVNSSGCIGRCAVAMKSTNKRTHIDAYDVALFDYPISGNSVDDLFVDGDAGACRESVIIQERRHRALADYIVMDCFVNFMGCNAGPYHTTREFAGCRGNSTGTTHEVNVAIGFYRDHTTHQEPP